MNYDYHMLCLNDLVSARMIYTEIHSCHCETVVLSCCGHWLNLGWSKYITLDVDLILIDLYFSKTNGQKYIFMPWATNGKMFIWQLNRKQSTSHTFQVATFSLSCVFRVCVMQCYCLNGLMRIGALQHTYLYLRTKFRQQFDKVCP